MSENKKSKKTEAPANNIQWVGKREKLNKETGKRELVPVNAPPFINDSETRIKLPAPEVQAKGFFHEDADVIIALFPNDFKKPTDKSGK